MLQNVRHAGGSPPNDSEEPGTVRVRFDFSAAGPELDQNRIDVFDPDTGRAHPLAVERRGTQGGIAQFRLGPGDVVLFKYATGRRFVGF